MHAILAGGLSLGLSYLFIIYYGSGMELSVMSSFAFLMFSLRQLEQDVRDCNPCSPAGSNGNSGAQIH
jgi:hypothetical protein